MRVRFKSVSGFTLIELVIVVTIVAILLAVALPGYQEQVRKTKRSLARAELQELLGRQEQFFVNNRSYATTLSQLGYTDGGYGIDTDGNDIAKSAADAIYNLQFNGTPSSTLYAFEAVPLGDQVEDRCGTLRITSTGVKTQAGTGSDQECW